MKTVVGLFDQFDEARRAVQDLRDAGYSNDDISMIARDEGGQYSRYLDADKQGDKEKVGDGAAAGAGVGAVLGGLGGLLVGLGALMIPGIGPVIAAGPIITTLAGAGVGAVAGGVVGSLVDLGIPDEHANYYAEGVRRGGTLVVLRTDDMRADGAADIMNRYHPVDVERRAADWRQTGDWKGFNAESGEYKDTSMSQDRDYNRMHNASAIPVTGTEDIDTRGGLDDLSHGQDYNRDSGTGMGAGTHRGVGTNDMMDDDNDIPVTGSGMGSGTSAQDYGRNQGLGMTDSSSRQNLGDESTGTTDRDYNTGVGNQGYNRGSTADDRDLGQQGYNRDEGLGHTGNMEHDRDFNSSKSGRDFEQSNYRTSDSNMNDDIPVTGSRMADPAYPTTRSGSDMGTMGNDWSTYDTQFRSDYMDRYSNTGQSYAYYQPAYRFGYDLRSQDQYRDWDWNRMEPVARQEWQRRGLVGRWEDFQDAVRHAWDSVTH